MTFKSGGIPWNKGLNKEKEPKLGGRTPWNKGFNANDSAIIASKSLLMKELNNKGIMKHPPSFLGKKHTADTKRKISERLSINNRGGRCKWYEVSGQKVQGTWERDIAIKFNEMNINWAKLKTNKDIIKYEINGLTRSYTPDFYLKDYDLYIEVKGYWWGNDRNKMNAVLEQHPEKRIVVIEKQEYERIMCGELVW